MTRENLWDDVKEVLCTITGHNAIQPTLPASKVSVVLHEPAILGGYRVPHQPWSYYFLSLFQLHNETVNVWSHLIGCCIIIHKLYSYFQEFDIGIDSVFSVLFVFGISCIICLLTSALVHLLHAKSSYVHFVGFSLDYIGATVGSFGAGYACFYGLSDERYYRSMEGTFLPILTVVSYANCVTLFMAKIWYGHDPHNMRRKFLFVGGMGIQALFNMSPFVPRYIKCYYDDTCSMTSTNHLTTLTVVFVLEAITFAAHQPEKCWPGKFDIFGHGHQWFHVLIVANHVFILDSIYDDHVSGLTNHKDPNLCVAVAVMGAMIILDLITLYWLSPIIPECLKKVKSVEGETKRS